MVHLDLLFFNIRAFICAIFLFDYGADHFIDVTVIMTRQLGLLTVLFTVGAKWEKLAMLITALAQHSPSLTLGNIIGSHVGICKSA
jgi:Ca2+/Na+ antiporter